MPQPQPRQQSRLNDIQMLQQHIMFKHLQEQQRQHQFQELGDARQQNHINQKSMINKQVSGDQFPPQVNGTPVQDVSKRFMVNNMNLVRHGVSSVVQGFSNGMGFPQAQSQALHTMGLVSPHFDAYIYGTPVASAGNNLGPYSHLLGEFHDSVNVFVKGNNNQEEKPIMQSSPFSKSLRSNQCDASSNQVCMQVGDFVSRHEFQEKNLFGKVPTQVTNSEALVGNFQQTNTHQRHKSMMELGGRQEQAGLPDLFPEKMTNDGPSQGLCSLDPLEQKILFNMDDNSWEASFGRHSKISTGGSGSTIESTENANAFPSVQSGSWSALMQSAVAEASSSDNGLQEEWSGLSIQNPEISTDNQPSNFMDSGKPQFNWVDNILQCTSSLSSKPELQFNNSNTSSSFPGFQQSGFQFSLEQKQGMLSECSHESNQQSPNPNNNNKWLDCNPQQEQTIEVSQPIQRLLPFQSAWLGQNNEHSESNAYQQSISSYTSRIEAGNITEAAYGESHNLLKTRDNHMETSFFNSIGGLEHVKSSHVNTGRHVLESHELGYMKDADVSVRDEIIENVGYNQHNQSNIPQICINSYKGPSGTYEKQEHFQRESSNDSYHSNASQHTIIGHELRNSARIHKSDVWHMAEGNQKPSDRVLCQQIPQGPSGNELGNAEQFKFSGNVSGSGMDLEKGQLPNVQRNLTEEVPAKNNVGSDISVFFDRASGFHGSNVTAQTSQNMLELLHKVEDSKDYQLGMHFGSKDSTSFLDVPQVENPDSAAAQPYNNKPSPSQCFGLRLSPPSERLPFSNCVDSPQSSPKRGNSSRTVSFSPSHVRNQLQNQQQLTASVACQSQEAILLGLGSSQETSLQKSTNPCDQQLPISEANQVSQPFAMSGMFQQAGFSMRLPNRWTTVPTQGNLSGTEPHKVPFSLLPSPDSTSSGLETASTAPQELHNETHFKGGNEAGTRSLNSEGFGFQGEHDKKETPVQQISSGTFDPVSQKGKLSYEQVSVAKTLFEANARATGSLMTNSYQQGFDRAQHSNNQSRRISDIEVFGRSLKPSHVPSQNYSVLHQMHSVTNVQNDPSKRLLAKYNGIDSDLNVQQEAANTEQQLYEHTSGVQNVVNNGLIQGLMYDPSAAHQFSPGKPFENLDMNSSIVQVSSPGTGQKSSGWPTIANTLAAVKRLSTPYMLPPDVSAQNLPVLRPKKRKIAVFELLPWHREVTQGSQRLLDISVSGQEWAQAANQLIEKVDEAATNEDAPILRPKKRLILTTQLLQHLFRPAPAVILSGDAASNCYSVAYFAARLALGDACFLSSSSCTPCDISDMSPENPKTPERSGGPEITGVVENFINRAKKLETDFLILDKSASISELRVESQELEKFSVINRFAKLHIRGQVKTAEASTSSVAMRAFPHRYVIAAPMPRTVPEGAQCLSI